MDLSQAFYARDPRAVAKRSEAFIKRKTMISYFVKNRSFLF